MHGVTHRRQAWYPVLDQLAEQREVILVDLPGHGQSAPLVTEGRPVQQVLREQFKQFLTDQQLDRPHVAGNSLGGLVALYAGAEGDARSVTALSPAGFWRNGHEFRYTKQIFQRAATMSERLGDRVELLARTRGGRKLMYGLLCAHPARVTPDQAVGDIRAFRYARPALRTLLDAAEPFDMEIPLDVPVTIAWAARDLVLPPWQAEAARQAFPFGEHITMRGVGHVPMTDAPEFVAKILLRGSEPAASVAPITAAPSTAPAVRRTARAATA
ncbi:MAG TPA: alpha/beta fold hydrolase [Jatrophihabitans sp.]|uniref:alpha/beta fold hydrolase n=1 Tax=Jatrophihabitans sp. TaxID=1932789 RepID=UPI002E007C65|nr:alpha/beta fold hydrolase [Jatrophihabitans sp.]